MKNKKLLIASIAIVSCLVLITASLFLLNKREIQHSKQQAANTNSSDKNTTNEQQTNNQNDSNAAQPANQQPSTTPSTTPTTQWPVQISTTDASSVTVVVNKKHQLPSTYTPSPLVTYGGYQLRNDAASAMDSLFAGAATAGYNLKMISGYRSYTYQKNLYNNYVAQYGQAQADTFSARPGFSEHQLGLAADVGNANGSCDLDICFGTSAAGQWIAANAQNYGYIVRYPQGKETETGYQYEPWHIRFVGVDVAKSVYSSGKTLDQYYNVPAGGYE